MEKIIPLFSHQLLLPSGKMKPNFFILLSLARVRTKSPRMKKIKKKKSPFLSDNQLTCQPGDVIPELCHQHLPLCLVLAMLGKVEAAVLIEDETEATWIDLLERPQHGGGVKLILSHLIQQGTVRESQGQPTDLWAMDGFNAVRLVLHLSRRLLTVLESAGQRCCWLGGQSQRSLVGSRVSFLPFVLSW